MFATLIQYWACQLKCSLLNEACYNIVSGILALHICDKVVRALIIYACIYNISATLIQSWATQLEFFFWNQACLNIVIPMLKYQYWPNIDAASLKKEFGVHDKNIVGATRKVLLKKTPAKRFVTLTRLVL